MASSANKSQESRTQFPSETMSGEFDPVSSSNFKNQKHSWPSVPLSPQLRYSLSRKQPRIPVSPPASSSFSPSPITVASIEKGSYFEVPARLWRDNRVWSRDFYLSRNSLLLKKMTHRRIHKRGFVDEEPDTYSSEWELMPYILQDEFWVTYPIQRPRRLENANPPRFNPLFHNVAVATSIAYVNLPLVSTRYSLKLSSDCPEPHYDGIPFPWVTNTTGTNFPDFWSFDSPAFPFLVGHVECPICCKIWLIDVLLPERFIIVHNRLGLIREKINQYGEELALQQSYFYCRCDGNVNPVRPIISDHLNKINWMFLFLGYGIGFCTIDQLKYYCHQRRLLPIPDNKNKILFTVFDDLWQQIFLKRVGAYE